jgi:hypothetical protein
MYAPILDLLSYQGPLARGTQHAGLAADQYAGDRYYILLLLVGGELLHQDLYGDLGDEGSSAREER